jgi:hypothetical protein
MSAARCGCGATRCRLRRERRRAILLLALAAASVACATDSPPATPRERALEQRLQDGVDRFARVARRSPAALVVTLQESQRVETPRGTLDGLARQIGREAFSSAAARDGDTVIVEFHRARRIGPLALPGRVTRFTFARSPTPRGDAGRSP